MSISSNAQRLIVAPDAEESNSLQPRVSTIAETVVCSFCFGSGMEVVLGKGHGVANIREKCSNEVTESCTNTALLRGVLARQLASREELLLTVLYINNTDGVMLIG